jgi:hypothetical protein
MDNAVDTDSTVQMGFLPPRAGGSELTTVDTEVVELALLIPRWQAVALENAAHQRGLTAGQMLRKLIGNSLNFNS